MGQSGENQNKEKRGIAQGHPLHSKYLRARFWMVVFLLNTTGHIGLTGVNHSKLTQSCLLSYIIAHNLFTRDSPGFKFVMNVVE